MGLLDDSTWMRNSTEKYLGLLEDKHLHQQIDPLDYLNKKILSFILLNQYNKGLPIVDSLLGTRFELFFHKSYFAILRAYLTQSIQQNRQGYIPAIKAAYKKAKASDFDWYVMKQFMNPDGQFRGGSIIDYVTPDKYVLQQYFKNRVHGFKKGEGSFSFADMGNVIRMVSYIKIAHAIQEENSKLIKEISSDLVKAHKEPVKIIDNSFASVFPGNEPGAAIVLMKDDKVLLRKGFGVADINTKKNIDDNTNFNVGSISKMFTATAILLLKQENKLSLQDHIIKYLPDVNPDIGNKITIYHLLTHSSGLPHYIPTKDSVKGLTVMDRDTYNDDKNIDSLDFEPGTKFSYSNIGYRWLSMIVENVSGLKFGDFVRKNIFLPANMKNSYELNRDMPIPGFAHAYKNENGSFSEYDYGEEPQFSTLGDGGVVSSITDFIEWEKALRSNKLLSKDLFNESIGPQIITENPNIHYGYGWFIETSPGHKTTYSHSGQNGAFYSYFLRIPDKNVMCTIFMNRIDTPIVIYYVLEVLKDAKWY